jgi:hypothetical protein
MMKNSIFVIFVCIVVTCSLSIKKRGVDQHEHGESWNVLKVKPEGGDMEIDSQLIERLFMHPEVKNRKPVIISIVGAFRKGKSFFLDYCLRYLYKNVRF